MGSFLINLMVNINEKTPKKTIKDIVKFYWQESEIQMYYINHCLNNSENINKDEHLFAINKVIFFMKQIKKAIEDEK